MMVQAIKFPGDIKPDQFWRLYFKALGCAPILISPAIIIESLGLEFFRV